MNANAYPREIDVPTPATGRAIPGQKREATVYMPYKDPECKRQWEQEHRELRNARRKAQRLDAGSGQASVPKATPDLTAALRLPVGEQAPDPALDQGSQGIWIALLGLAVAIGVVLLAVFGVSGFNASHFPTRGPGNLDEKPG